MSRLSNTYAFAKQWYVAHERYLVSFALLGGFILDWFTLQRIDTFRANIFLAAYLIIAAVGIVFIHLYDARYAEDELSAEAQRNVFQRMVSWLRLGTPLAIQFAFGGLFSVFVVFYTRSGPFSTSWLFILVLVALLVGNEGFKEYYEHLSFQISILFFAIFSFTIFYVPIVVGDISTPVFLLSGVVSLFLALLFLLVMKWVAPRRFYASRTSTLSGIAAIFVAINLFYFINVIPPIPLSLQAGEVVHQVERLGRSSYLVYDEQPEGLWWYRDLFSAFESEEIHVLSNEPVYFWSSVFAPTDLNTRIVHHWQRYNSTTNDWESGSRIAFTISGGREDGYRGFSFKRNISAGLWRVDVETDNGRVIGRRTFEIVTVNSEEQRPSIIRTVR